MRVFWLCFVQDPVPRNLIFAALRILAVRACPILKTAPRMSTLRWLASHPSWRTPYFPQPAYLQGKDQNGWFLPEDGSGTSSESETDSDGSLSFGTPIKGGDVQDWTRSRSVPSIEGTAASLFSSPTPNSLPPLLVQQDGEGNTMPTSSSDIDMQRLRITGHHLVDDSGQRIQQKPVALWRAFEASSDDSSEAESPTAFGRRVPRSRRAFLRSLSDIRARSRSLLLAAQSPDASSTKRASFAISRERCYLNMTQLRSALAILCGIHPLHELEWHPDILAAMVSATQARLLQFSEIAEQAANSHVVLRPLSEGDLELERMKDLRAAPVVPGARPPGAVDRTSGPTSPPRVHHRSAASSEKDNAMQPSRATAGRGYLHISSGKLPTEVTAHSNRLVAVPFGNIRGNVSPRVSWMYPPSPTRSPTSSPVSASPPSPPAAPSPPSQPPASPAGGSYSGWSWLDETSRKKLMLRGIRRHCRYDVSPVLKLFMFLLCDPESLGESRQRRRWTQYRSSGMEDAVSMSTWEDVADQVFAWERRQHLAAAYSGAPHGKVLRLRDWENFSLPAVLSAPEDQRTPSSPEPVRVSRRSRRMREAAPVSKDNAFGLATALHRTLLYQTLANSPTGRAWASWLVGNGGGVRHGYSSLSLDPHFSSFSRKHFAVDAPFSARTEEAPEGVEDLSREACIYMARALSHTVTRFASHSAKLMQAGFIEKLDGSSDFGRMLQGVFLLSCSFQELRTPLLTPLLVRWPRGNS